MNIHFHKLNQLASHLSKFELEGLLRELGFQVEEDIVYANGSPQGQFDFHRDRILIIPLKQKPNRI